MRSSFAFPLMCCAALSLSGCMGYPSPMARGYSSYDQLYKSAPGAKGHDIGYDYSNFDNKNVLQEMRYVAQDLVDKLDKKLSFNVDEIYLKVYKNNAFYNSFDHLIRDELTHRGYALSNSPINTVTVDFISSDKLPECHPDAKNNEGPYKVLYLALALNVIEGEFRDSVGGFYEVPAFDYENTSHVDVMIPPCLVEQTAAIDEAPVMLEVLAPSREEPKEIEVIEEIAETAGQAVESPTDILSVVPEE